MVKVAGGAVLGLLAVEIASEGILGSDPCVRISDHMYKGVGRVDGELGKATSQLDQLERSSKPQVKWFSSTSWLSELDHPAQGADLYFSELHRAALHFT
ncbi:hypothetical protein DY000_02020082 [Brassica cretica]|uniref:Uncharacterized protein n=1 Tax=Brassica cretica TaxID=69181 RepID=A0ABQ7EKE2_BRACR|nr:hypothetical protein DY000_02020082 [Brassica cretica]